MYVRSAFATISGAVALMAGGLATAEERERSGWSVGLGVAAFESPYRSADGEATIVPWISYEGERLSLSPLGLSFDVVSAEGLRVAALVSPSIQATDFDDAPALRGMSDRNSTLEVGARVELDLGGGIASIEVLTDALSEHDGQRAVLAYALLCPVGDLTLRPRVAVTWQSEDLVAYYYGVRATEVRPGRPVYAPGDSITQTVALDFNYALTDRLSAVGSASFEFLSDEITRSPIVEDDGVGQAFVGLVYGF